MLKHHPCAYCGRSDLPRTKGHVLPANIYPDGIPKVQRITVSECQSCKILWEDAEPHFRNILLGIWNSDSLPVDNRIDAMWRGFHAADGRRRAKELFDLIQPSRSTLRGREVIYPANDARFNLILRRIVRGLAAKHRIGHAIPDESVTCGAMIWEVPPAFASTFLWHVIAPDFFAYAYAANLEDSLHSFWLLQFSRHLLFFGAVERQKSGAPAPPREDG